MTLRVGFLGAGFIAGLHAFQLQQCETPNEIAAVYDPDDDRSRSFADSTGAHICRSPAAVIAASDVVFVCSWTSEHPPLLDLVINARRAVFMEKPIGVDLASAHAMADAVSASGVTNGVGLVLRSSPAFIALRHLIDHPEAGRPMNIVLRDDQYLPIQGIYNSDWRADRARAGSGVLLEHSIHDMDILEWLFGPISTVSAQTAFFHGIEGIEDSVSVVARFEGGHTATLASIWHDVLSRPSQRRMEVFSESSYVSLDGDLVGPVCWTRRSAGPEGIVEGELDGSSIMQWLDDQGYEVVSAEEQFLRTVSSGSGSDSPSQSQSPSPSQSPTVADALRAHVLVDAAYRSAADGGVPIEIPPLQESSLDVSGSDSPPGREEL